MGKVLAFSTDKPVCGVPTLEALAYSARNESALVCPVISAGTRDTVYAAFYRARDGNVARISEYYVGDVQGLSEMVKEPTVIVGFEAQSYRRLINQSPNLADVNIKAIEVVPNGVAVARLAAGRLEHGESDDVLALTPLYLKESTAKAFMGRYSGNAYRMD